MQKPILENRVKSMRNFCREQINSMERSCYVGSAGMRTEEVPTAESRENETIRLFGFKSFEVDGLDQLNE